MSHEARKQIVDAIIDEGVVAVVRMDDPSQLMQVIEAIAEGGVRAVEITLTVPGALDRISEAANRFGDAIVLGAGSVRTSAQARQAVDAGARYIVSPMFALEIVEVAHRLGAPAIPGAFTPTEIHTAVAAGADIVKVFPADILGMKFFKSVKAPMPELLLMPTGGVTLTNADAWLNAGACAVGIGSALITREAIASSDFAKLRENARTVRACIDDFRGNS